MLNKIDSSPRVCQFMKAHTSGRSGALALRLVRQAAKLIGNERLIRLIEALECLSQHVAATIPRRICLAARDRPLFVFTELLPLPASCLSEAF